LYRTQQVGAPFTGGLIPVGQAPFCGEGQSSLFWEFVSNPSLLRSNLLYSISIEPPELVPEYPSALYSDWLYLITCVQSWAQPPM
jgi:hypothetical protein